MSTSSSTATPSAPATPASTRRRDSHSPKPSMDSSSLRSASASTDRGGDLKDVSPAPPGTPGVHSSSSSSHTTTSSSSHTHHSTSSSSSRAHGHGHSPHHAHHSSGAEKAAVPATSTSPATTDSVSGLAALSASASASATAGATPSRASSASSGVAAASVPASTTASTSVVTRDPTPELDSSISTAVSTPVTGTALGSFSGHTTASSVSGAQSPGGSKVVQHRFNITLNTASPLKPAATVFVRWRRGLSKNKGCSAQKVVQPNGVAEWNESIPPFAVPLTKLKEGGYEEKLLKFTLCQKGKIGSIGKGTINLSDYADLGGLTQTKAVKTGKSLLNITFNSINMGSTIICDDDTEDSSDSDDSSDGFSSDSSDYKHKKPKDKDHSTPRKPEPPLALVDKDREKIVKTLTSEKEKQIKPGTQPPNFREAVLEELKIASAKAELSSSLEDRMEKLETELKQAKQREIEANVRIEYLTNEVQRLGGNIFPESTPEGEAMRKKAEEERKKGEKDLKRAQAEAKHYKKKLHHVLDKRQKEEEERKRNVAQFEQMQNSELAAKEQVRKLQEECINLRGPGSGSKPEEAKTLAAKFIDLERQLLVANTLQKAFFLTDTPCFDPYNIPLPCVAAVDLIRNSHSFTSKPDEFLFRSLCTAITATVKLYSQNTTMSMFWFVNTWHILQGVYQNMREVHYVFPISESDMRFVVKPPTAESSNPIHVFVSDLKTILVNQFFSIVSTATTQLEPIIIHALLEQQTAVFDKSSASQGKKQSIDIVVGVLSELLQRTQAAKLPDSLCHQVFSQVYFWINAIVFNHILTHPTTCTCSTGFQIRLSLSALDDFLNQHTNTRKARSFLNHTKQAANLMVIDKAVLQSAMECSLFGSLTQAHIATIVLSLRPDKNFPDSPMPESLLAEMQKVDCSALQQLDPKELKIPEA